MAKVSEKIVASMFRQELFERAETKKKTIMVERP
jgi:hypothetical protein